MRAARYRVVLYQPPYDVRGGPMKPIAPLALLFLAAALDPDTYDVQIVDGQIEDDPLDD